MPATANQGLGMTKLKINLTWLLLSLSATALGDATSDFNTLLDEHWEWTLANSPVMASMMGDRRYNQEWGDAGLKAVEQEHLDTREFLRRAYAIDRNALSDADQLNYELFRRQLQDEVDVHQFGDFLLPFDHQGGIQNLDIMASRLRFTSVADYDDWLARLGKIDTVIDQTIERAEAGRKAGLMPPAILMQRMPDQLEAQVVEFAADSPFFRPFAALPESFPATDRERLRAEATEVIEDTVIPAYRELADYFDTTYLPAASESVGLSSLANGSAWYEHQARSYTTTRLTPDEIHRIGLDEVKRIRDEMAEVMAEVEFDDWMFLQADGVMINRAVISKFGIDLGEVTIAFSKHDVAAVSDR